MALATLIKRLQDIMRGDAGGGGGGGGDELDSFLTYLMKLIFLIMTKGMRLTTFMKLY